MRLLHFGLAMLFCASSLLAQNKPLHGIDINDIDREANPCQDFYEFANGKIGRASCRERVSIDV